MLIYARAAPARPSQRWEKAIEPHFTFSVSLSLLLLSFFLSFFLSFLLLLLLLLFLKLNVEIEIRMNWTGRDEMAPRRRCGKRGNLIKRGI